MSKAYKTTRKPVVKVEWTNDYGKQTETYGTESAARERVQELREYFNRQPIMRGTYEMVCVECYGTGRVDAHEATKVGGGRVIYSPTETICLTCS